MEVEWVGWWWSGWDGSGGEGRTEVEWVGWRWSGWNGGGVGRMEVDCLEYLSTIITILLLCIQITKAVKQLRANHRLILSGTPIQVGCCLRRQYGYITLVQHDCRH